MRVPFSFSTSPLTPHPAFGHPLPGGEGRHRLGFTLVELLVSVGLVVMIMLMFAEVFRSATGMITTQKGIAENDGRERTIQTIMLNDFKKRTFQELVPFQALLNHDTRLLKSSDNRKGYFYISENDPNNNTDDVLAFTVRSNTPVSGLDSSIPFYGRTTSLQQFNYTYSSGGPGTGTFDLGFDPTGLINAGGKLSIVGSLASPTSSPNIDGIYTIQSWLPSGVITVVEPIPSVTLTTNGKLHISIGNIFGEPELDDEQFTINRVSYSTTAEVCYFLRNGNLYRRQLLIRESPDQSSSGNVDLIPGDYGATVAYNAGNVFAGNSFWNDFDFSAHRIVGEDTNENGIPDTNETDGAASAPFFDNGDAVLDGYGIRFHVADDLSNRGNGSQPERPYSFGFTSYRYGYAPSLGGLPREYLDPSDPSTFIGRFTQQESAHPDFGYPGFIPPGQNPMNRGGLNTTGAVTAYEGLDRRGEDIIATNVHEFDIKVFAANFGADGAPGVANYDDDGDGFADWLDPPYNTIPDLEEVGAAGSDDLIDFFDLGRGGNGLYTATANAGYGNRFDTWHVSANSSAPYRLRSNGADKQPGLANWDDDQDDYTDNYYGVGADGQPGVAGVDDDGNGLVDDEVELGWSGSDDGFGADGQPGVAGVDDDFNGNFDDISELGWPGSDDDYLRELGFIGTDDEVPLRAIQIRIRFMDAASNQMRQMTMVFSLDDLQ